MISKNESFDSKNDIFSFDLKKFPDNVFEYDDKLIKQLKS